MLPHVGPSGAKSARSAHSVAVARWTALPRLDRVMRKLRTRKLNAGSEKKHTRAHRRWTVGRSAGNFDDAVKMVHGATELAIHEVVSVVPPLSCDWHSGRADGAGVSALMGRGGCIQTSPPAAPDIAPRTWACMQRRGPWRCPKILPVALRCPSNLTHAGASQAGGQNWRPRRLLIAC